MNLRADPQSRVLNVILVHGTWGRGLFKNRDDPHPGDPLKARWFSKGSYFRSKLEENLKDYDLHYHDFFWSGSNSVRARADSAKKLAVLLSGIPGEKVLICHSHAGNIGAIAVSQCADSCKLITLATPFVELIVKDPASFQRFIDFTAPTLTSSLLMSAIIAWLHTGLENSYLGYVVVICLLFHFPLRGLVKTAIGKTIGVNGYFHRVAISLENDTRYEIPSCHDILVVRGVDDEAALALSAGVIVNRLSFVVGKFATFSVIFAISLSLFAFLIALYDAADQILFTAILGVTKYLIYSHVLTLLLASLVGSACKASFGRDLFFRTFWCELKINSTPDFDGLMKIETLSDKFEEIAQVGVAGPQYTFARHSIYNHPETASEICSWLKNLRS